MSREQHFLNPLTGSCKARSPGTRLSFMMVALCAMAAPQAAWAWDAVTAADREMAFVEKSYEATELFNQRQYAQALALFHELMNHYADLDQDGYVAVSLADCLHELGRVDEARAAYEYAASVHPALTETVTDRLWELALSGEPDESLLNQLRAVVTTDLENAYLRRLQLGRALQKRALALLGEAAVLFREAAQTDPGTMKPTRRGVAAQAEMVAEIKEDLASLISRMERSWGTLHRPGNLAEALDSADADAQTQGYRAAWNTLSAEGQQVRLEASLDGSECKAVVSATANGRPIPLDANQSLIIRRHQERINAILLEAMQAQTSGNEQPSERSEH